MNKPDFFKWLKDEGCDIIPKEGINNSSPPIEAINRKTKAYCYFFLSPYSDKVSADTIEKCIKQLGISAPPQRY
jgi:hypothetical protein